MIRKYLCENIVRLLEAYIELTECNFVFIWSSDPVLLQHIFCLTESDSFLRQVETWHNCVVKSGNFTKIVSQKSGDAPYCQPEPGAGKWWYFFFKCPLAMYILCPMFNLFLIKYKGVFHERNLSSPYFRFSIICYFNVKAVPHNERHIFKIDISHGKSTMCA